MLMHHIQYETCCKAVCVCLPMSPCSCCQWVCVCGLTVDVCWRECRPPPDRPHAQSSLQCVWLRVFTHTHNIWLCCRTGEKVMQDDEFTCDLFRFLQLLCEGHNSGASHLSTGSLTLQPSSTLSAKPYRSELRKHRGNCNIIKDLGNLK